MASVSQRTPRVPRDTRRRQLLDGARTVLEADGYRDMGMREVAAEAGVSPSLLYTYFPSREGLFAVLYAERLDRFTAEVTAPCAAATDLQTLLRAIADAYAPMYRIYAREMSPWTARGGGGFLHADVAAQLIPSATAALATVTGGIERLAGPLTEIQHSAVWAMLTGICDRVTGGRARVVPIVWDELADAATGMLAAALADRQPG